MQGSMRYVDASEATALFLQMDLNLSNVEYELVRIDAPAPEGETAAAGSSEQLSAS